MRILLVELSRFRSRRAIVLMLVAGALLTAFVAGTTVWDTRPVSAQDRAAAQARADDQAQSPMVAEELAMCESDPQSYLGPQGSAAGCRDAVVPRAEWFLERSELSLAAEVDDAGAGVLILLLAIMIIVGTTFAGGDWASGSMSNQLLFEPRRARVWLGKAVAVFLATMLSTTAILAAFWGTLFAVAARRGLDTGASVTEQVLWSSGRGVLLAGVAGLGAYALTMLLRHTVGTLSVLFAYVVGGEILVASLPVEGAARWSLGNNVLAWLQDGYKYYDATVPCTKTVCDQMVGLPLADAAAYLGALLVLVVALSLPLFRRRDIP